MRNWRKPRKWQFAVLATLIASLLVFFLGGSLLENGISSRIDVEVPVVTIDKLNWVQVGATVDVQIHNRNWFGFTIKQVDFAICFHDGEDWIHLGDGRINDVHINSGDEAYFQVPLTAKNTTLLRLITRAGIFDSPKMKVTGIAKVDLGPFNLTRSFEQDPEEILSNNNIPEFRINIGSIQTEWTK